MPRRHVRYFGLAICVYVVIQMYTYGMFILSGASSDRLMYRPSTTVTIEKRSVIKDETNETKTPKTTHIEMTPKYIPVYVPIQQPQASIRILRGRYRSKQGFLTIGLSSVPRVGASYLVDTLESLFSRLTDKQADEVVVVLYLGSQDEVWVNNTMADLDRRFQKEIENTLLQVIQPLPHIYPNFSEITKRNFGDNLERVRLRTKQNVDFAHLFYHCRNISKFYIQIEDDVLVASDFMNDIKRFVGRQDAKNISWFAIEFSTLGFIGKMFHSRHLSIIKDYLLMFKEEQPCDMLINHLKRVMVQPKDIRSTVSLFQHIGKVSSLENKTQKLTDKRFKDSRRHKDMYRIIKDVDYSKQSKHKSKLYPKSFTNPNPKAKITTTLDVYKDYKAENAYLLDSTFFWGKDPKNGDYIEIKLEEVTYITGVFIKTGHPRLHTDKLENGAVRLAHNLNMDQDCNVEADHTEHFSENCDLTFTEPRPIKCVVIVVNQDQKTWLAISEIQLRTET